MDLACTGLYGAGGVLAEGVRPFAPSTAFWSDGAEKRRWISLPGPIDTSDPDAWVFPVGTKAWKELSVGGRRVETRYFEKVRDDRWVRATYLWSDDGALAQRNDAGVRNALGTGFDVPKTDDCDGCHEGRKERLLGFDAIGLGADGASGVTLATLGAEGKLTRPFPARPISTFDPALAWLHVNCGVTCHNPNENATGNATGLRLRLSVDADGRTSADEIFRTTLGVPATQPQYAGQVRIAPGAPDASLLVSLVSMRGTDQMPPIATRIVDERGVAALRQWIGAMRPTTPAESTRILESLGWGQREAEKGWP
jgi:hypothetical protein